MWKKVSGWLQVFFQPLVVAWDLSSESLFSEQEEKQGLL